MMTERVAPPFSDEGNRERVDGLDARLFRRGGRWVGASLWLKRRDILILLAVTLVIYGVALVVPVLSQQAIDRVSRGAAGSTLLWLGVAAILAVALEAALKSWQQRTVIRLSTFLNRRIARKAFALLMHLPADSRAVTAGEMITRFQQVEKVPEILTNLIPRTVFDAGGAIVAGLLIFHYDRVIGTATLAIAVGAGLYLRHGLNLLEHLNQRYFTASGKRQGILSESIAGFATVKALALEADRMGRWKTVSDAAIAALKHLRDQLRRVVIATDVVTGSVNLAVLALGCWRILDHHLTVGALVAIQLLAARAIAPVLLSGELARHYQDAKLALTELGRMMAEPQDRAVSPPAIRAMAEQGITVRDLTLTYPSKTVPALDGVSFTLPGRGIFALVGRNGSGKSSLIHILLGLQRHFTGTVTVAGHDIRRFDPRWLRSHLGVADQDTTLFSGSVRGNVTAGSQNPDDSKLRDALGFTDALKFVEAMPGALDAKIAETGRNLSAGQRQRLAVSRAIARDPHLLLLDEPSQFLDSEAAVALERRLMAWGRNRLVLMVTHRLAAARGADAILVLDDGRLVGFGPHAALLRDCPTYAALWADDIRADVTPPPDHAD